jgi:hypothetical protein
MQQDSFTQFVQMVLSAHHSANETAGFVLPLLLLLGAIGGFLLARWIFRGGLSRKR